MGTNQSRNAPAENKMKTPAILFVLAVIYASSEAAQDFAPQDSILPLDDDLSEAHETLALMQKMGNSKSECRKLVTETKKEITTNVNNQQKIIDGLSKGHECSALKKQADDEKVEQKRTEDKQKAAKTHLDKMRTATVNFGSRSFSSITKGDCSYFFSHSSYTTAKANYKAAQKAYQEAQGAAAKAVEETKKAVAAARKATARPSRHTLLPSRIPSRVMLPMRRPGKWRTSSSACSTARPAARSHLAQRPRLHLSPLQQLQSLALLPSQRRGCNVSRILHELPIEL